MDRVRKDWQYEELNENLNTLHNIDYKNQLNEIASQCFEPIDTPGRNHHSISPTAQANPLTSPVSRSPPKNRFETQRHE